MSKQYLVLRSFNSFGKFLVKGTVVDESEVRSPRLRQSEGKVVPAVSSLEVPVEIGTEAPAPRGSSKGKIVLKKGK